MSKSSRHVQRDTTLIVWLRCRARSMAVGPNTGGLARTRLHFWLEAWLRRRRHLSRSVRWLLGMVARRGLPPHPGRPVLTSMPGTWRIIAADQSSRSSASGTSDQGPGAP